jgi:hypothetical protein
MSFRSPESKKLHVLCHFLCSESLICFALLATKLHAPLAGNNGYANRSTAIDTNGVKICGLDRVRSVAEMKAHF